MLCIKDTLIWLGPQTTIGGNVVAALMISCKTRTLAKIILEIMGTSGRFTDCIVCAK